jgi:hypothetical protein
MTPVYSVLERLLMSTRSRSGDYASTQLPDRDSAERGFLGHGSNERGTDRVNRFTVNK